MGYNIDDFKKLLDGFKKDLSALKEKFAGEQKFVDLKLQDGTVVRISGDQPLANAQISAIDEAGQLIPLPTGNYVAEDGAMIVVADGVITEYTPKDKPAETPAPNANEAMTEEQKATAKTIIESIVKESRFVSETILDEKIKVVNEAIAKTNELFVTLQKENETAKAEAKTEIEKQKEFSKQLFALVEKLGELPVEKPIVPTENKFNKQDPTGWTDLLATAKDLHKNTFN